MLAMAGLSLLDLPLGQDHGLAVDDLKRWRKQAFIPAISSRRLLGSDLRARSCRSIPVLGGVGRRLQGLSYVSIADKEALRVSD